MHGESENETLATIEVGPTETKKGRGITEVKEWDFAVGGSWQREKAKMVNLLKLVICTRTHVDFILGHLTQFGRITSLQLCN